MKTLAKIAAYYGASIGMKGYAGVDRYAEQGDKTLAYAKSSSLVYINAPGGFAPAAFNNSNNFKSILFHEKRHQKDILEGRQITYKLHYDVYVAQMDDQETFGKAEASFQRSTAASAVNHLLNAYFQDTEQDDYDPDYFDQDIDGLNFMLRESGTGMQVSVSDDRKSFTIFQTINGKTTQYNGQYKELKSPSN